MKELEKSELMEVDGGILGIDDIIAGIIIGCAVATFANVIGNWDDFKKGFASAF
jgi:lactobin A/cerein 7B family class IIb bacteriocin